MLTAQLVGVVAASANAPNPQPSTNAVMSTNADGTVTANLSGTWTWPGQNCAGRYGEDWAVDWWGISTSPTPANPFSLTSAGEVLTQGTSGSGTISPAGSIKIPDGTYFHVAKYYAGEDINSASTCTDVTINNQAGSEGSWTATATYPAVTDVPKSLCVNLYDPHGNEGKPSTGGNDNSPVADNDNSIQTNQFNPNVGGGFCAAPTFSQTIQAEIYPCVNGAPSTTPVAGGSLAVTGTNVSGPNPLAPTKVAAGTYTVTATAPPADKFVACGQSGVTISSQSAASTSVTVPSGGSGDAKFYVAAVTQTIQAEIYSCVNGSASTTLVTGGSLAVSNGGPSGANPLTATQVASGSYTVTATAPSGYMFVPCGSSATITGTSSATETASVASGGSADATFYVAPIGYLEICQSSANGVQGDFYFWTAENSWITVPVGACSAAMPVPAGNVLVHQYPATGYAVTGVTTQPSGDLESVNLPTADAWVYVTPGGVSTQTIVTFTDAPVQGSIKVCQVAGSGVANEAPFTFGTSAGSQTVTVPAGPASSGGYCVEFSGTFTGGQDVTITQQPVSGTSVSAISVEPSDQNVYTDTANRRATVLVGAGVTEVTFVDTAP